MKYYLIKNHTRSKVALRNSIINDIIQCNCHYTSNNTKVYIDKLSILRHLIKCRKQHRNYFHTLKLNIEPLY